MSVLRIEAGPSPWQVLQRCEDGAALLELFGSSESEAAEIQVRVTRMDDGASPAGLEWRAAAVDGRRWSSRLTIPVGGPYRIETRAKESGTDWQPGDAIPFVFVGDVWVIAGQSNAVGYGDAPCVDPPMLGVSLFHTSGHWQLAAHPLFDATGSQYPQIRGPGRAGVSPWLAFGKRILERTGVPIGLIPTALAGSALDAWLPEDGPGEAWTNGSSSAGALKGPRAPLWENMGRMIDDAGGAVAGLLWYQGETDAAERSKAEMYLARFERFVDAFRQRYGEELPVLTAQLNRSFSTIFPVGEGWSLVTEAQRQAALRLPGLWVVPTLDLELEDAIHTGAQSNVTLGLRFADAALAGVYGQGDVTLGRPADLERARFDDRERRAIRVTFRGVSDRLRSTRDDVEGFGVTDDEGPIAIVRATLVDKDALRLELERPAVGPTHLRLASGARETTSLRDGRGWPPLAFHGIGVDE